MRKKVVCEFIVDVEGISPSDDVIVNAFFNQLNMAIVTGKQIGRAHV